eukprot:g13659.t1
MLLPSDDRFKSEDFVDDPASQIRMLGKFLQHPPGAELLKKLVHQSSRSFMLEHESKFDCHTYGWTQSGSNATSHLLFVMLLLLGLLAAFIGLQPTLSRSLATRLWILARTHYRRTMSHFSDSKTGMKHFASILHAVRIYPCLSDPLIEKVHQRVEYFQIVQYEPGQFYRPHQDQNSKADSLVGVRLSTFFLYLQTPEAGGATYFPKLGVKVQAEAGLALWWPNAMRVCQFVTAHKKYKERQHSSPSRVLIARPCPVPEFAFSTMASKKPVATGWCHLFKASLEAVVWIHISRILLLLAPTTGFSHDLHIRDNISIPIPPGFTALSPSLPGKLVVTSFEATPFIGKNGVFMADVGKTSGPAQDLWLNGLLVARGLNSITVVGAEVFGFPAVALGDGFLVPSHTTGGVWIMEASPEPQTLKQPDAWKCYHLGLVQAGQRMPEDFCCSLEIDVSFHDRHISEICSVLRCAVLLLSTHSDGLLPPSCAHFGTLLADHVHDFRVGRSAMKHLHFAVLGFGSSVYASAGHFCTAAVRADGALAAMGAQRVARLTRVTDTQEQADQVAAWKEELHAAVSVALRGTNPQQAIGVEGREAAEAAVSNTVDLAGEDDDASESEESTTAEKKGASDVEELAEGCANKCVFCWRHHKNPVGTEWKWSMDPPDQIVADGVEQHKRMIRECKGIPGVKKERFDEAMNVRHCALYPRINELVEELHKREISTFLVTNAQFPEAIRKLRPITQLYISVDAGTKETLKAVDRPLFADFWPRYLDSMKALAEKEQRTVYRLTLVKGQNMEDAGDYAKLVALGKPDFIEIKSVTFCGESKASSLTIANTPWHEEVKTFSEALFCQEGLDAEYELACEHQHSCIVLLANKRFKVNGQWHTWIDYNRFHELVKAGVHFDATDYWAPTPDWALYGSEEACPLPRDIDIFVQRAAKSCRRHLC